MEKLLEKLDNLEKALDEEEIVKEIRKLNARIKAEKIEDLVARYHITQDNKLKEQILQNELFREYKEKETDLNILILKIKERLKEITKKDKCGL